MVRAAGIEPASRAWQAPILAVRRRQHWHPVLDSNQSAQVRSLSSSSGGRGATWCGWRDSNPHDEVGSLTSCRWMTPALLTRLDQPQPPVQFLRRYLVRMVVGPVIAPNPISASFLEQSQHADAPDFAREHSHELATAAGVEPAGRSFGDFTSTTTSRPFGVSNGIRTRFIRFTA